MSREWKPGDVALVEAGCWANRKVALRLAEGWAHINGVNVDGDGVVDAARPLVVIDPEDREAVERLMDIYEAVPFASDKAADKPQVTEMQAALREYAKTTPPKPEEPTGLGAVARDASGALWVRVDMDEDWPWTKHEDDSLTYFNWREIDATEVLTQGAPV